HLRVIQPLQVGQTASKGFLAIFGSMEYVKMVANSGAVEITPVGVSELDYKSGAYRVGRLYRVSTRRAVVEIHVIAMGTESSRSECEGRQWSIGFPECGVKKTTLTDLGTRIAGLRQQASEFAQKWISKLLRNESPAAYLDTQKAEDREKIRTRFILQFVT